MIISGPEIDKALDDCEVGDAVTLTITGTRTEDGLEVETVEKEYDHEPEEKESKGEKMPKGIAIILQPK